MTQVVPAIIPINKEQLEEEIKKVSGFAELIQIDICDGTFTNTKTWPYNGKDADFFEALKHEEIGWPKWEDMEIELHLMVENPEDILTDWIHTGISTVIVQIEATEKMREIAHMCQESQIALGIAIKPSTNPIMLDEYAEWADFIQVMGSDALGRHGVDLDPSAVEMVHHLHLRFPDKTIAIDIGVDLETKETLLEAGATKLVSGSAILEADYPEEVFNELSE